MLEIVVRPELYHFDKVKEFANEFSIGEGDLVITNEYIYQPYFGALNLKCDVLYQESMERASLMTRWWKQ